MEGLIARLFLWAINRYNTLVVATFIMGVFHALPALVQAWSGNPFPAAMLGFASGAYIGFSFSFHFFIKYERLSIRSKEEARKYNLLRRLRNDS